MGKTKWTPAQQTAIDHRGSSLLVTAAAGSGKTAVLAERVVQLLSDREKSVQADRLLIVTFTNAAAAELRSRISRELDAAIRSAAQEKNTASVNYLHTQKVRLQRADICTVDAFCLSLLHKNFAALDIPPDFKTAEEGDLYRLRQESLAAVLEKAYNDPHFCDFANLYGRSRSDQRAGEIVLQVYDFLRSLPRPERALEEFCRKWEEDCTLEETAWGNELVTEAFRQASAADSMAHTALDMADSDDMAHDNYGPTIEKDVNKLEALCVALEDNFIGGDPEKKSNSQGWRTISAMLNAWEWDRLKAIRGEKSPDCETVKGLRENYKELIKKLKDNIFICTPEEFEEDRKKAAPMVRALSRAVLDFEETYFNAKVAEKVLEFSDFEHLALHLLMNGDGSRTLAAERIAADYDVVMVDEYQDSNTLQDAIYRCLSNADMSNQFLVGDLKQSIYRFRQADPAVFMKKMDRWPLIEPESNIPKGNVSLALDANFRSSPSVVKGINYFFENMMTRDLGGVDYSRKQKLVAKAAMPLDEQGVPYSGFVEMHTVEGDIPFSDAPFIARRIMELVESGYPVRDGEELRPCTYGDFCILLRTRKGFAAYSNALEECGIPVYADVAEDLLDAPQVRPFVALLQVLDNPAQDIALASVMLSPIFGFSPDDLLKLRVERKDGSLYGALTASKRDEMRAFCGELDHLRRLSRTLTVPELMEELLARTGYLAAVGAMPGGPQRQEGLRAFIAWANRAGQGGLQALLRSIDAAARMDGIPVSDRGQTQPGCVSVMTVHRSKGLEFPIVFIGDTGHNFNPQDSLGSVLLHAELGIGMNLKPEGGAGLYKTLPNAAVSHRLRAESLSEEMRILYVALTRARDGLIIMLPLADGKQLRYAALDCVNPFVMRTSLMSSPNWASWLLRAAMLHPDADCLRDGTGFSLHPNDTDSHIFFSRKVADQPPEMTEQRGHLPQEKPDEELLKALEKKFAWQDERRILRTIPGKVTVTSVVHGSEKTILQRPAFMYKEGLTGAERGTAVHAFLQAADMSLAAQDLAEEIERQKARRLITPEMAEKLDVTMLERFFASEVFRRMTLAKQVMREYAFITSLPAGAAMMDKTADYGDAKTLVQGVADLVLVFEDHAEIVDYKTDRGAAPEEFVRRYEKQLLLYRYALCKRLPVPITRLTVYSLALGQEIDIPLKNV